MAEIKGPFTIARLAEYWGCSDQHIRNLINRGELPAIRIGKLIRIRQQDVERFDQQQAEERGRQASGVPDLAQRPFTIEMLSERWGCSQQHIRNLVTSGTLSCFRDGRLIRVRREDVEALEQPQTQGPPSPPPSAARPAVATAPLRRRRKIKLPNGRVIEITVD